MELNDRIIVEIRNAIPAPWGIREEEIMFGMKNWNYASIGKNDVEFYSHLRESVIHTLVREKSIWQRIATSLGI